MSEDRKATPKLNAALVAAIKSTGDIAKNSENTFAKYKYTASEDIIAECRRALTDHGLALIPTGAHTEETQTGTMAHIDFVLTHESGEERTVSTEWPYEEAKGRPRDKAYAGSRTTALAYILRDLLLIPRRDDNEADKRDDTKHLPGVGGKTDTQPNRAAGAGDAGKQEEMSEWGRFKPLMVEAVYNKKSLNHEQAQWLLPRLAQLRYDPAGAEDMFKACEWDSTAILKRVQAELKEQKNA